jgi:hypothetical protein
MRSTLVLLDALVVSLSDLSESRLRDLYVLFFIHHYVLRFLIFGFENNPNASSSKSYPVQLKK